MTLTTSSQIPERLCLIIGAMKSGTTSLYHYLVQHPEVCPCGHKEPNYFASDENWAKGPQWYADFWEWNAAKHKIGLEGTIHYTDVARYPQASERIAQTTGVDFRFIYIMRNPLERIESQAMMAALGGWSSVIRPEGVKQQAIDVSSYAKQLDVYVDRFGRDKILLLHTEDLAQHPVDVLKSCCRHMGVDDGHEFDATKRRYKDRRKAIAEGDPPLFRRLSAGTVGRFAAQLTPQFIKRPLKTWLMRKTDSSCRLTPAQRADVTRQLLPDLRKLAEVYGVDVESRWGISLADGRGVGA